jgi:hypothetical protein
MAQKSDELRFTRQQAAKLARLSVERFDAAIRPLIPDAATEKNGRTLLMAGEAVVDAIAAHRARQGETDPLMAGTVADSPALERYRLARARAAEMDLQERERTHLPIGELDGMLTHFASHLRRGGETLQRRFGNEASEIFNDAVDAAERAARKELTQRNGIDHATTRTTCA